MKYTGEKNNQVLDFIYEDHISFNEYRQKYFNKLIDHLSGKNKMSDKEIELSLDALYSAIYSEYLNIHRLIKDIYLSVIYIKYADNINDQNIKSDIGIIFRIFDSIISLQEYREDIIENDLIEVYTEIIKDKSEYSVYLPKYEDNEEFHFNHIFDINYHLENLKQYSNDPIFLETIEDLLNRKGYR